MRSFEKVKDAYWRGSCLSLQSCRSVRVFVCTNVYKVLAVGEQEEVGRALCVLGLGVWWVLRQTAQSHLHLSVWVWIRSDPLLCRQSVMRLFLLCSNHTQCCTSYSPLTPATTAFVLRFCYAVPILIKITKRVYCRLFEIIWVRKSSLLALVDGLWKI